MTKIKIKKINVLDYKPKENLATLEVEFIKDSEEHKITKDLVLKHPSTLVKHLFLAVKSKDKLIFDTPASDPLESLEKYSPILIENEDKVEEKMTNFITDLCHKAKVMKTNREASKHMRLIDEFKTSRLELVASEKKQREKKDPYYLRMLKKNI